MRAFLLFPLGVWCERCRSQKTCAFDSRHYHPSELLCACVASWGSIRKTCHSAIRMLTSCPRPYPPPPLCSVIFRLREANPYFLLGGYVVRCRQHPMCPTMCVHSMQNSVRVRRVIHYGASDAIAAQLDGALISSSSKMMYTQAQQRSAHAQQLFARTRAHAHLRTRTCTCRNYDTSVWGDDERGLEDQLEMN